MHGRRWKRLLMLPIGILAIAIFGFVVMSLWNWLVPALFAGKAITFWQALGVLVLSRILVGGFHGRGRFVHKWDQLTPEEREKFRAAMHARGVERAEGQA